MKNYITQSLKKDPNFITALKTGTSKVFDSDNIVKLFDGKKLQLKAIRDDDNDKIYLIEKRESKVTIYYADIYSFNKNESIEKILYLDLSKINEDDFKIYKDEIASFDMKNENNVKNENEFIQKIKEEVKDTKMVQVYLNYIEKLKEKLGQNILQTMLEDFKCNENSFSIKNYMDFLKKEKYIAESYSDDFYLGLNKEACKDNQSSVDNWILCLNALIEACKEHGFTQDNCFEYNDADNHVFLENGNLIITNQNIGFYINKKDNDNFDIYSFEKELKGTQEEVNKIHEKIKENVSLTNQTVVSVQDGIIVRINNAYIYCLNLDIEYSKQAMVAKDLIKIEYPVDMTTYEYQKNYYCHTYHINEFEFITQAMMTLGGGFDYDKKNGTFIDNSVKYIKDLPNTPLDKDKKITNFNYLMPKNISHLNKDWLEAIKYAVEVLQRDRPIPIVVAHNKTVNEALDEAIDYYSSKIKLLEKKKLSNK